MSHEVISCPLSACFIGMSHAQALAAQSLRWSDAVSKDFDAASAREAYEALREPEQTSDGEPSFLDRMLRRVGMGPLSRNAAETTAMGFLLTLRTAGLLKGPPPQPTNARDEDLHGHVDPDTWNALRVVISSAAFSTLDPAGRLEAFREADETGARLRHRPASPSFPSLLLAEHAAIYLPYELARVIHGVPFDVGSTSALLGEIDALVDAFDLRRTANGHIALPDEERASRHTRALVELLDLLASAARRAEESDRVVALSR